MQAGPCTASTSRRQVSPAIRPRRGPISQQPAPSSRCNAPDDPLPIIDHIHARKMKAGVAISPDTPSAAVTDAVADAADMLLVMTVYPGRGGQKFLARCVPKVAELRARFPDKDIEVGQDDAQETKKRGHALGRGLWITAISAIARMIKTAT